MRCQELRTTISSFFFLLFCRSSFKTSALCVLYEVMSKLDIIPTRCHYGSALPFCLCLFIHRHVSKQLRFISICRSSHQPSKKPFLHILGKCFGRFHRNCRCVVYLGPISYDAVHLPQLNPLRFHYNRRI